VDGPGAASSSGAAAAEVRETHSAVVLLCGDRAYKVKKPVDLGFLDFSTPERRRAACHRELLLNRRMTPDAYLEVLDVLDELGHQRDSVLVMRRMPDECRLATLVRRGVDVSSGMRRLAKQVATFHATARTNGEIGAEGGPVALGRRWQSTIAGLRELAPSRVTAEQVDEVETLAAAYIAGRVGLLEERVRDGRVRDGHGDLLADDVFLLPDGPRVLDCLDFDDHLRWMDVVDDVASLVMDLERLGAPQVAEQLVRDYHEFSGAVEPASLSHHYVAYRAVMRAKIAAIRERAAAGAAAADAATEAGLLVGLGLRHLRAGLPRLVLVGGAPAAGKTTVADRVVERLRAAGLTADRLRKELAGLDPREHHPEAFGEGLYSAAHTTAVYRALATKARFMVGHGETVVVDASFATPGQRELFRAVARELHTPVVELECVARPEELTSRLRSRELHPSRYSDADLAVGTRLAAERAVWEGATPIDTSGTVAESVAAAVRAVQAASVPG
jgi:aminoglycoside phosphotransferase family enzyme/predicted kinase